MSGRTIADPGTSGLRPRREAISGTGWSFPFMRTPRQWCNTHSVTVPETATVLPPRNRTGRPRRAPTARTLGARKGTDPRPGVSRRPAASMAGRFNNRVRRVAPDTRAAARRIAGCRRDGMHSRTTRRAARMIADRSARAIGARPAPMDASRTRGRRTLGPSSPRPAATAPMSPYPTTDQTRGTSVTLPLRALSSRAKVTANVRSASP